jgi:hypothetical protein
LGKVLKSVVSLSKLCQWQAPFRTVFNSFRFTSGADEDDLEGNRSNGKTKMSRRYIEAVQGGFLIVMYKIWSLEALAKHRRQLSWPVKLPTEKYQALLEDWDKAYHYLQYY